MPIIIDNFEKRGVTQEECDTFLKSLPHIWNKESYIAVINDLHTQLFNDILISYNYISMGELLF